MTQTFGALVQLGTSRLKVKVISQISRSRGQNVLFSAMNERHGVTHLCIICLKFVCGFVCGQRAGRPWTAGVPRARAADAVYGVCSAP